MLRQIFFLLKKSMTSQLRKLQIVFYCYIYPREHASEAEVTNVMYIN